MTTSSVPRRPGLFRLYYAAVVASAAVLAGLAWPHAPQASFAVLGVGLVLLLLAELAPMRLPGGGQMTAGTMVDLPLILLLGPFWTAAIDVVTTLLVQGLLRRRPLVRVVHNLSLIHI